MQGRGVRRDVRERPSQALLVGGRHHDGPKMDVQQGQALCVALAGRTPAGADQGGGRWHVAGRSSAYACRRRVRRDSPKSTVADVRHEPERGGARPTAPRRGCAGPLTSTVAAFVPAAVGANLTSISHVTPPTQTRRAEQPSRTIPGSGRLQATGRSRPPWRPGCRRSSRHGCCRRCRVVECDRVHGVARGTGAATPTPWSSIGVAAAGFPTRRRTTSSRAPTPLAEQDRDLRAHRPAIVGGGVSSRRPRRSAGRRSTADRARRCSGSGPTCSVPTAQSRSRTRSAPAPATPRGRSPTASR